MNNMNLRLAFKFLLIQAFCYVFFGTVLVSIYKNDVNLNAKGNQIPKIIYQRNQVRNNQVTGSPKKELPEYIDFEDFDNENGTSYQIIPNVVHYLFLNKPVVDFYHMVNILSLYLNHGPDKIYFHCDNCSFSGKFFEALKSNQKLWNLIEIHPIPFHSTIFRKKYGWINHHR